MTKFSIVFPIYNEEKIIKQQIIYYLSGLKELQINFEIVLSENGSTDNTKLLCKELKELFPEKIKTIYSDIPNYGLALKKGIKESEGDYIVCEEIDLCNLEFLKAGIILLKKDDYQIIVGSKNHINSFDKRPFFRILASKVLLMLLKIFFGFGGTDTHGLKIFKRKDIINLVEKTVLDKDMFATELIIRAYNAKLTYIELPIKLEEIRLTQIPLYKRVPKALNHLFKLLKLKYIKKDF